MKSDIVLLCVLATILGNCWHSAAFITLPAQTATGTNVGGGGAPQTQQTSGAVNKDAAAAMASIMAAYPDAASYMNTATGTVSFQPHDDDASMEELNERTVYDLGDELLRALNAEMAASGQDLGTLPEEPDYADTVYTELEVASKQDMMRKLEHDLREEQEIVSKSALLMKLLEDPNVDTLPVVYVEETPADNMNSLLYPPTMGLAKRSRYYRRYPWKRHNRNRSTYEPELRYACTPSKEDVFKLLVNLHENRKGNHSKTVNFCNRKRPAKAIFTNIRFLG